MGIFPRKDATRVDLIGKGEAPVTYAIGDIHGEVTLLRRLLALLPFRTQDTLVFLGDYMDRGEDSIAVIGELRALAQRHARSIFLRGNHEDAWLEGWDGARFSRPSAIDGGQGVWDDCEGRIPYAVGAFLEQTRVEYEDAFAYYIHAGALPGRSIARTPDFLKMWGVCDFLTSAYDWGKPVVFGHWKLPEPLVQANKIGIDTGAYKTGALTAVRLPDRRIFQAKRA